jgi:putative ABC transport system substrate-binding protein
MLKRRTFLGTLSASLLATPLAAEAQTPAVPIVGILNMQTLDTEMPRLAALRQGLKETGFLEGHNVALENRFADGHVDRLSALAADLVQRRVSVLMANTTPPAMAARAAASTIPIVFAFGADPVELGLVASFNRPGGNITGVAFLVNKLVGKRLELLVAVVSKIRSDRHAV